MVPGKWKKKCGTPTPEDKIKTVGAFEEKRSRLCGSEEARSLGRLWEQPAEETLVTIY